MPSVLVEIVCCSVADAIATAEGGAHRIELCAALEVGGLTPSPGLLEEIKSRCDLPVRAMIRPRPGGFCYSSDDLDVMERDVRWLISAGADGLVFGVLTAQGTVDADACRRLLDSATGKPVTFHRAFDVTPNLAESLETITALGFSHVLTSGGAANALEGADTLRSLQSQAAGRITLLPGGGVRAENVVPIIQRTGCSEVHLAPTRPVTDPTAQGNGIDYDGYCIIDGEAVAAVVQELGIRR